MFYNVATLISFYIFRHNSVFVFHTLPHTGSGRQQWPHRHAVSVPSLDLSDFDLHVSHSRTTHGRWQASQWFTNFSEQRTAFSRIADRETKWKHCARTFQVIALTDGGNPIMSLYCSPRVTLVIISIIIFTLLHFNKESYIRSFFSFVKLESE